MTTFRKDAVNLASQTVVKLISVPFSLFAVGIGARRLSAHDSYLLLSAQNALVLIGLLQLGFGAFILRRVAHDWARGAGIRSTPEVRGAFALIIFTVMLAMASLIAAVSANRLPPSMLPLLLIAIIALIAQVADQVRLAIGELFKTNLFQVAAYTFCLGLVALALGTRSPIVWLLFVGAFAAQFIGNIASFAAMLRRSDFRQLVRPQAPFDFPGAVRESAPLIFGTAGVALLLNMPLAGHLLPGFPPIDAAALACLRLFTSGLTLTYFALQPLTPIILRHRYREPARFRRHAAILLGLFLCMALAGGAIFYLVGPPFIAVWLGTVQVEPALAFRWGILASLWLTLTALVFFTQVTSRPGLGAACLYLTCAAVAIAAKVLPGANVETVMIAGVAPGVLCAATIAMVALMDSHRPAVLPTTPDLP